MRRLRGSRSPAVIGLGRTADVTRSAAASLLGPDFRLLSGDDATALAFFAMGGDGCISVTSNVAPGLCRAMYSACKEGHSAQAQRLAALVAKLTAALFRESSPAPVKYALSSMQLMSPRVRLPLVDLRNESKTEIDRILAQACVAYPGCMIGTVFGQHQNGVQPFAETRRKRRFAVVS